FAGRSGSRALVYLGIGAIALIAASCSSSTPGAKNASHTSASSASKVSTKAIVLAASGRLGTILTDSEGRSLYRYTHDSSGKSTCYGTLQVSGRPC
ncbi:MAG: hypothetical protein ACRD6W_13185, partial [Nitrososphaerales archaeon]